MNGTDKILGIPLKERIENALQMCRPFLQADGGDVELIRIAEGGVVELTFHGTCTFCPLSPMTLRAGIERTILRYAPEVKRVESVARTN